MEIFEPPLQMVRRLADNIQARLVIRHSARFPILSEEEVFKVGLTPHGVTQAEKFGRELGKIRKPGRMISSPVGRCLETAQAIARGAGWAIQAVTDVRLRDLFYDPTRKAFPPNSRKECLPGQISGMLDLILDCEVQPGAIDLFITHDMILAGLAGYFTGHTFSYPEDWPEFLEGILFWNESGQFHFRWREKTVVIGHWPIPGPKQLQFDFSNS